MKTITKLKSADKDSADDGENKTKANDDGADDNDGAKGDNDAYDENDEIEIESESKKIRKGA